MIRWRFVWLFVLLVALQVFIVNQITLGGMINPQVYPLFILVLPTRIKGWMLLLLAFILGLLIDMFSDSLAIHAAASVFMAFCRPTVFRLTIGPRQQDNDMDPSFRSMGGITLSVYTIILILLHHAMLFFLEIFRFTEFMQTLSRIFLSAIFSFLFLMIAFAILERSTSRSAR